MSSLLKDVGAIAGLASFLGLALVALLYFAQARDIRRLRENASFLVEGGSEDGETVTPAERTATAVAAKEPEKAAAAAAATAPNEAEAFRRAELARQAAERRRRFDQRRRRPSNGRERPDWLSDWKSIAAIVLIGVIVLCWGRLRRQPDSGRQLHLRHSGSRQEQGPLSARADQGRRAERDSESRPGRGLRRAAQAEGLQDDAGRQHGLPLQHQRGHVRPATGEGVRAE